MNETFNFALQKSRTCGQKLFPPYSKLDHDYWWLSLLFFFSFFWILQQYVDYYKSRTQNLSFIKKTYMARLNKVETN